MPRHILVVEDEVKTSETIRLYLEKEGFEVSCAHDGAAALKESRSRPFDLVVLDLMLPSINGYDVCRALRRESRVPIVMLTARSTEDDKLAGLDMGADDYLTKPFSPRELIARVKAVLRRTSDAVQPTLVRCGRLVLDEERQRAVLGGTDVRLTPSELRILATLARAPGRVYSRAELIERALGGDGEVFERTVDAHVTNLRRKFRAAAGVDVVRTVFGTGYCIAEDL